MHLAQALKPDGRLILCALQPRVAEVLAVTRIIPAPGVPASGAGPALLEASPTLAEALARL
jgi:hypothetical protein